MVGQGSVCVAGDWLIPPDGAAAGVEVAAPGVYMLPWSTVTGAVINSYMDA